MPRICDWNVQQLDENEEIPFLPTNCCLATSNVSVETINSAHRAVVVLYHQRTFYFDASSHALWETFHFADLFSAWDAIRSNGYSCIIVPAYKTQASIFVTLGDVASAIRFWNSFVIERIVWQAILSKCSNTIYAQIFFHWLENAQTRKKVVFSCLTVLVGGIDFSICFPIVVHNVTTFSKIIFFRFFGSSRIRLHPKTVTKGGRQGRNFHVTLMPDVLNSEHVNLKLCSLRVERYSMNVTVWMKNIHANLTSIDENRKEI